MADNERQLTDKQRAFVDAYLGECNFNATKAAQAAGYAIPKQSGTECLSNPIVRKEIDHYFDQLKNEGLRNKNVRIKKLIDLDNSLETIQMERAKEARALLEKGFAVPSGALEGLMVEVKKVSGNGKTVTEWQVDKTLLSERRALADQIAKELGDYVQKQELTGKDGGPLTVALAEDAYDALLGDINNSIL